MAKTQIYNLYVICTILKIHYKSTVIAILQQKRATKGIKYLFVSSLYIGNYTVFFIFVSKNYTRKKSLLLSRYIVIRKMFPK